MDTNKPDCESKSCCQPTAGKKPQGFWQGLLYGLLPHTFCILFIVFSIVGSVAGATLASRFLLIPYFFQFLILLSFIFALISAFFYLKRSGRLDWLGIKKSWKYLLILFGSTLAVNLVLFYGIFPAVANFDNGQALSGDQTLVLTVALPCSGHAPLVTQDLLTQPGINSVKYRLANNSFVISYDPLSVTVEQILRREIFKEFKAEIVKPAE